MDLNKFSKLMDTSQLEYVKNKWDCLSISKEKIQLKNNGFLFVDEISADMFI